MTMPEQDSQETEMAWASHIERLAQHMPYPPTPALPVPKKTPPSLRLRWAVALLPFIGLVMSVVIVPELRAGLLAFLHIGAVQVTVPTTTPIGTPTPPDYVSIADLWGETTLEEAQAQFDYPIRLPTLLPTPDKVFLQNLHADMIILAWIDPHSSDKANFVLFIMPPGSIGLKTTPEILEETTVHGQRALWVQGEHLLQVSRAGQPQQQMKHLVTGNVLIWTEGDLTYRLETPLALAEVIQIAKSLQALPAD